MTKKKQETVLCQICKEQKKISEVLSAEIIREPIVERIKAAHPDWSSEGFICISDLNHFRAEYVTSLALRNSTCLKQKFLPRFSVRFTF